MGKPLLNAGLELLMTTLFRGILLKTLPAILMKTGCIRPLILASCLFFIPLIAAANDDINIEHNDGLFSITADNASLSNVVSRLSELTEIPMNIAEEQDTQITLSVNDYTLDSLITELSSSSMIVRKNINGEDVISEVVFMLGSEGNNVAAAELPSGEPNEGIITGEYAEEVMAEPEPDEAPRTVIEIPAGADEQALSAPSATE